ncbi:MAG: hypothetical protein IPK99_12500 [Flavobacteriales bacterium]|nr:hypothetical protein [Flavobacteriales bacterium]
MRASVTALVHLLAGIAVIAAQDPVHRRYTTADGLPSNTIYTALQDREGFMWFGTDAGAVRFDGREFRVFGTEEGVSDVEVINLAEDSHGRMWFLTLNGRLSYYQKGQVHNARTDRELGRYQCASGWQSFVEDAEGLLWFGGVRRNLLRLDLEGARDTLWDVASADLSLLTGADGEVVLVTDESIYRIAQGRWVLTDSLPVSGANSIVRDPVPGGPGAIAIGPNGFMHVVDRHWEKVPLFPHHVEPLANRNAVADRSGIIWLLDRSGVASGYWPSPLEKVHRSFFSGIYTNYLYEDREGNRWFCTARNGLLRVTADQWRSAHYPDPKPGGSGMFLSLLKDRAGTLWAGTADGIVVTVENGTMSGNLLSNSSERGRVMEFVEGRDGVYAATDRSVVWFGDRKEVHDILLDGVMASGQRSIFPMASKSISASREGTIWSSYFTINKIHDRSDGRFFEVVPGTPAWQRTQCIHVDPAGVVWSATGNTLYRYKDGKTTSFPHSDSIMGLRITSITSLSADTLLVSTFGKGIALLSDGRYVGSINKAHGLPSNDVRRVRMRGDTLLAATNAGLGIMRFHTGRPDEVWVISTANGLLSNEVYDAEIVEGDLYVATAEGLSRYPFPQPELPGAAPATHFASILVNGAPKPQGSLLTLDEGKDLLRVKFHAITFAAPERVEYSYSFAGDTAWTKSLDGTLDLAGMRPGDHRLTFRARHPGGPWSKPEVLAFQVRPFWWNEVWVRVVALVLAGGILVLLSRYLLKRRYRTVFQRLREREAVNEERRRIAADVHDDLGADLSRLLLHARQAELKPDQAVLKQVTDGLGASIEKIDEIIWSLDPRKDSLLATIAFIEQQAREYLALNGIDFRTYVEQPGTDISVSAEDRRAMLLIVREAVRNAAEHGAPSVVLIEWRMERSRVRCAIIDDGRGMPVQPGGTDRHGLRNMRERAAMIGATLTWTAREPHGTVVEMRWPMSGII